MSLLQAFIGLAVLIFVHELGHFLAAKAVGIGVIRFSIGFGPTTPLRFRRRETEYVVSWIPFGGYVKMASREEQEAMAALEGGQLEQEFPEAKLFESKPLWARIVTILAGVVMNALFAWAVFFGLTLAYGRVEDPTTAVARIEASALPEAAAALGEVPPGARIVRIGGEEVGSWNDIRALVMEPRTKRLAIEFAGEVGTIVVDVPGTDAQRRADIANAMIPLWPARIHSVVSGSPAAAAGIEPGDTIAAIDGEPIASWDGMVRRVQPSAGKELVLSIEREGTALEVPVVPDEYREEDPQTGETLRIGRIGVQGPLLEEKRTRFGVWGSVVEGTRRTWETTGMVLFALKGLVTGQISARELGGPILIVQASAEFARAGLRELLFFMAFLSINLAILNLLPIPVLDGGHLVFLILEGIRRRPLSVELRYRLTQVGLLVILGIMMLALRNDLFRVFDWW